MTCEQELAFAILCSPLGWPNHRWREARQQIADLINVQAKECSDKDAHVECLQSLIEQQAREIEALKADALRYRKLKTLDWYIGPDSVWCDESGLLDGYCNHNDADKLDEILDSIDSYFE